MPAESRQILGADKAYHTREFVETVLVPNTGKPGGWTIDARTTRHEGQAPTLKIRKLIEYPHRPTTDKLISIMNGS